MFSLVIPTYNEKENIVLLIEKIESALRGQNYEIIIVDDSSVDGTSNAVEDCKSTNPHIRLIKRIDERGLSSAVVVGFRAATGNILGVMDADHSHDPALLPEMHKRIENNEADCVVGSRLVTGGGVIRWPWHRRLFSLFARGAAVSIFNIKVLDPMSGFFCISRPCYEKVALQLRPKGYKILLEILVRAGELRIVELPYTFKDRLHGSSKVSLSVMFSYIQQLIDLSIYRTQAILNGYVKWQKNASS